MWCIVNLPNGTQQAVQLDSKSIGHECLEKVCEALGIICEMEYFGLELWTPNEKQSRTHQWINLRNRLTCDVSSGIQLMLALRVKFWVPVHFILQESVRNLFYMQAKVDLLEERLNAKDWTNAAKLAALLCQADGIRFNPLSLKSKYPLKDYQIQPQQTQCSHHSCHCKDKKEKEHVLSLKKRRLSKQKSIENIENVHTPASSIPALITQNIHLGAGATPSTTACSDSSINKFNSEDDRSSSPLHIYNEYIVRPSNDLGKEMPADFLHQIAVEHGKLSVLKMTPKSAKYWLLQEIADLPCYGEELFTGVTTIGETSIKCDAAVGAHGICITIGNDKKNIPFSAIAAAKSFRRVFKLEYLDDHNDRKELEIKLPKHAIAAGLYRSITERHAFYVCDKVRGVVTNQFTRDFKGTIASMFKEDTELGKRYVFDIQLTCREVHDQARRTLHERGIEVTSHSQAGEDFEAILQSLRKTVAFVPDNNGANGASSNSDLTNNSEFSMIRNLDLAIREKELRDTTIERCVDMRISEAMTCKICMDREINTMFSPCCHVLACSQCAARCANCPNCRAEVTKVVKIFLPPELRISKDYTKEIGGGSNLVVTTAA